MGDESMRWTARACLATTLRPAGFLVPLAAPVAAAWTVKQPPPAVGRIERLRNLLLVLAGSPGPAEHRPADASRHRPLTGMPLSGNVVLLRLPVPTPSGSPPRLPVAHPQRRATGAQNTKARPRQPCLRASISRTESADRRQVSDGITRRH
jgi:hypothetical protein